MTDKELIAIIESKLPQELSLDEIEAVRRRLPESPELRAAIAGQLELNDSLSATIGSIDLQADDIAAKATRFRRLRPRGVLAVLGWTACLLILACVAAALLFPKSRTSHDQAASLARQPNGSTTILSLKPIVPAPSAVATPPVTESAASDKSQSAMKTSSVAAADRQPIPKSNALLATNPPAADGAPQFPWQEKDQLGGPPRPWDQSALELIGAGVTDSNDINAGFSGDAPAMADVRQWFTPAHESWGQIRQTYWHGHPMPAINGLTQFHGPWSTDNVLRLSLCDCTRLAIHFWRGQSGLSLRTYNNSWSLAAYRTERSGAQPAPKNFVTLATDDMRNWMSCGGKYPWRLDLRFDGKEFTVSRGDLVLLRAPFDGLPSETYFDGQAMVAGIDMVRVKGGLPNESDLLPIAKEISRPADLDWRDGATTDSRPLTRSAERAESPNPSPARGEGNLRDGDFRRSTGGSVELMAHDAKAPVEQWFDLPRDGLYEIEMELDHLTPGTRVAFGSSAGEPTASVGFFANNRDGGLSCRLANFTDPRSNFDQAVERESCSFAATHEWIKLVGGCGLTRLYGSTDGVHWARFGIGPGDVCATPLTRFGLCCLPGKGDRTIALRRIVLRDFHELAQLAPAELIAQSPAISGDSIEQWRAEFAKQPAPSGANPADWQRACALRTIFGNPTPKLGRQLLAALYGYSFSLPLSVERRLKLAREIAAVSDDWTDGNAAANLITQFELTGEQLVREQHETPWTTLESAVLRAPIWSQGEFSATMPALARAEILQSIYSNHPEQVRQTLARLRLMNVADPLMPWADDWAASQSGAGPAGDAIGHRVAANPLIEESNKEGFDKLAEFESALDSQSYRDACQTITAPSAQQAGGLIPDPRDPQLLVTFDTAVVAAFRHNPALPETMSRQFGAAGMLEVRRAIDLSDADSMAAAASRYRGTPAASEACLWLGDRAAGGGNFNQARVWYRQAAQTGDASIAARVEPRDRLAAAMLGEDAGSPATEPVQLGQANLSATDFESLVADMRKSHASSAEPSGSTISAAAFAPAAPPPGHYAAQQVGELDGDVGNDPDDVAGAVPRRDNSLRWLRPPSANAFASLADSPENRVSIDWTARQMATAADNDRLYVSNRFQVAAYDAKNGKQLWRTELAGEHGQTHDWTLTPMRPLVAGSQLFVRRLTRSHVELAALDTAGGVVQWRTSPDLEIVSDPIWLGDAVAAICAMRHDGLTGFSLAMFDPTDGSLRRSRPIADMQENWWSERTCQLTRAGDNLVAVLCGAVVCCDISGKPRWIRKQLWIPPDADPNWGRQWQSPALVAGSQLLVTQPGVMAVECIDLDSGSLIWRAPMPGIHRMIGQVDERLLTETNYGIAALSLEKGALVWYHPAADLLAGQLCGGAGQFVYSTCEPVPSSPNQLRPVLVWLNVADGSEIARQPLGGLRQIRPALGPFAAAGNRIWLFSGGENDPNPSLYLLQPAGPIVSMSFLRSTPKQLSHSETRSQFTILRVSASPRE